MHQLQRRLKNVRAVAEQIALVLVARHNAHARPLYKHAVAGRKRELQPKLAVNVVCFALARKNGVIARYSGAVSRVYRDDECRVVHLKNRPNALDELRRCHPRVRLLSQRSRSRRLSRARYFGLQLACVVCAALDDAARKLGFVKTALPCRERRSIGRERGEIAVDSLHLRTVEHRIEERANERL